MFSQFTVFLSRSFTLNITICEIYQQMVQFVFPYDNLITSPISELIHADVFLVDVNKDPFYLWNLIIIFGICIFVSYYIILDTTFLYLLYQLSNVRQHGTFTRIPKILPANITSLSIAVGTLYPFLTIVLLLLITSEFCF